jgi:hypothetical protein
VSVISCYEFLSYGVAQKILIPERPKHVRLFLEFGSQGSRCNVTAPGAVEARSFRAKIRRETERGIEEAYGQTEPLIAVVCAKARPETIVKANSVRRQICASLSIKTFSDGETHTAIRTVVTCVTRGSAGDLGYTHPFVVEYALLSFATLGVFGAAASETLVWRTETPVGLRILRQNGESENQGKNHAKNPFYPNTCP